MASVGSLKVFAIAGRTDSAGAAQVDTDWEELRMGMFCGGAGPGMMASYIDGTPNPNGWQVRQNTGADQNVKIGSGTSKADVYVLRGTVAGQGQYAIRLDSTGLVVPFSGAPDASLPTRYGVYLFIDDAAYSGDASRAYAGVSCLKGTPNASPVTPGPLAVWSAYALLWEFQMVAGAANPITNTILDQASSIDQRTTASNPMVQNWLETAVFT
jgi:hypothetical protein